MTPPRSLALPAPSGHITLQVIPAFKHGGPAAEMTVGPINVGSQRPSSSITSSAADARKIAAWWRDVADWLDCK